MIELRPAPTRGQRFSRRCRCGCRTWATLVGLVDGVALIAGCPLTVHRWRRDLDHPGR